MKCQHRSTQSSEARPFRGPVSKGFEFEAAHGGNTYVETCSKCGARRKVNINGRWKEYGVWENAEGEIVS